jgi:hypothetical protein
MAQSLAERRRLRRTPELMALIAVGSRLAFRLAIFLGVLEVVAWFGNGSPAGRMLDTVAMLATAFVLWASSHGTRLLLGWLERAARPLDDPW